MWWLPLIFTAGNAGTQRENQTTTAPEMWDSCVMATALLIELRACQRCQRMEVFSVQHFYQHTHKASLTPCTFQDISACAHGHGHRLLQGLKSLFLNHWQFLTARLAALDPTEEASCSFDLLGWQPKELGMGRESISQAQKPDLSARVQEYLPHQEGWITAGIKTLGKKRVKQRQNGFVG